MENPICNWLVVDLPLWKMMEWKSVGIMTFPIYGKKNNMFQTTNQIYDKSYFSGWSTGYPHDLGHLHKPPKQSSHEKKTVFHQIFELKLMQTPQFSSFFHRKSSPPRPSRCDITRATLRRGQSCTSPQPSDQSPAQQRSREDLPMPLSPTINRDSPFQSCWEKLVTINLNRKVFF